MKNRKDFLVFLLVLLFCHTAISQTDYSILSSERLAQIESLEISEQAKEDLIEQLCFFATSPLNLNTANEAELQIIGLNDFQIFSLQHYIRQTGDLLSVHELVHINGFDEQTLKSIEPFVCVKKRYWKPSLRFDSIAKANVQQLRVQYRQVLSPSKGYTRTDGKGYLGPRFSSTVRYNFNYFDRMQFSVVADKDAGEPFFDSLQPFGFDHYSIQFTLKDIGIIKQLTLGDYRLNFAEGLAIGQGFSLSYLNTDAIIKKRTSGITPHRSSSEYGYNRGIATNIKILKTNLYLFASIDRNDCSTNLQTTGLHRTASELATKDSNLTRLFGFHYEYDNKGLQIGTTMFYYDFKDSLHHQNREYQKYYFEGKQNSIYSLNASYLFKHIRLFSELAMSQNKATAMIFALQFTFGYKTNLSISYRDYDKKFQNHYSDAIGVQSHTANERAINISFAHRLNSLFRYYIGSDFFHFPFSTYQTTPESNGCKLKSELTFTPSERAEIRLGSKFTLRQKDDKSSPSLLMTTNLLNNQITIRYTLGELLSIDLRAAHCISQSETYSDGYYFYIEPIITLPNLPLRINLRYSYFDTDNYDTHFSVYEYNLPMTFSSATLYDKGHRAYLFVRYDITKQLQLSFRYSITSYTDKETISSGNNMIASNNKQDVGIQLYFKF